MIALAIVVIGLLLAVSVVAGLAGALVAIRDLHRGIPASPWKLALAFAATLGSLYLAYAFNDWVRKTLDDQTRIERAAEARERGRTVIEGVPFEILRARPAPAASVTCASPMTEAAPARAAEPEEPRAAAPAPASKGLVRALDF